MTNQSNDSQMTFSEERQLYVRKKRTGFPVDSVDWERLKRMIKNYPEGINLWSSLASGAFSTALSIFLTLISITDKNYPYRTHLLVITAFSLAVGIMSTIFALIKKKEEGFTKKQIVEEMETMEINPVEEEVEGIKTKKYDFSNWIANRQKGVTQGVDFRELPLHGKLLKSLTFKVSSSKEYWRAGFKLSVPNQPAIPTLLTPQSFLFHTGVENGKVILYVYHDGNTTPTVHKILPGVPVNAPITITIERNENNYVRCFINDSVEYNLRFNPELFKKVYLAAWADSHPYNVSFDEIVYELE